MIEYSALVAHMTKELGFFDAIIGHSFGAANVVIAKSRHRVDTGKLVLLSCFGPSSFRVEPNRQNGRSSSSPVGMWAGCL
jgi:pimeloyl-ACP methyl ester carboxylesterase